MTRRWSLGVDLGGTNCRAALVTPDGKIAEAERIKTDIQDGLESFLRRLTDLCSGLIRKLEISDKALEGIGIGVPGLICTSGSVLESPNLKPLEGCCLSAELENSFGCPVAVVNDADAIAWGEALFGAGARFNSFVTLTLGTGVGGGLVLDQKLWKGADGFAGEIGHLMVEPEGRPCPCGSRGCLEQYASASGIVLSVLEGIAAGKQTRLRADGISAASISRAAMDGDTLSLLAYEEAGKRLGQALAVVTNLLNLDGAVIAGGASESFQLFQESLRKELLLRAFDRPASTLEVVKGVLGDEAGILGAAHILSEKGAQLSG